MKSKTIEKPFTIMKLKLSEQENTYYTNNDNSDIAMKVIDDKCGVKIEDDIFISDRYMDDENIYYFKNVNYQNIQDILFYISNNETAVAIFFKVSCFIIPELVSYDLIILNSMLKKEKRLLKLQYAPKPDSHDYYEYYHTGNLIESLLSEIND